MKSFTPVIRLAFLQLCMVCCFNAAAQPVLTTRVSSGKILIGEPVELTWEASLPGPGFIQWPVLPDSVTHFEWLELPVMDTSFSGGGISGLRQRIRFTSFDSGAWVFPAGTFRFTPIGGDSTWQLQTDSVVITVGYAPDSTGTIRDIKPLRRVEVEDSFWYWVAGIGLLLLLLGAGYWWYRKRQPRKIQETETDADAYTAAMLALEEMGGWKLEDAQAVRNYHQRLYDLFRQYLGRRSGISAHNKTTGDILVNLRGVPLPADDLFAAAAALRSCDAVKFAKYLPGPAACAENRTALMQLIRKIEESYRKPPTT